ncbi:TIGR02301 family protein [Caulobacter hibisci]|uniref:TIGR02301 family protein n=1 Tax=Caulobacter hibisci TaxID=2035993 RepID=A0ABS0T2V3_9CAUL|nr:TIGR02301 family protein [Caulobacter hibisci]MBI1686154.1 TIGR02301 family protein [Caulobacter hibisci]
MPAARPAALLFAALLAVAPSLAPGLATAQDRGPAERQRLLDLAYAIGQSHALRQACEGIGDQFWRARMVRLTEVEQADQAFDGQLRDRFNGGYAAAQAAYPECGPESRRAERQAAQRGRALAIKLSQTVRINEQAAPDSMADERGAR